MQYKQPRPVFPLTGVTPAQTLEFQAPFHRALGRQRSWNLLGWGALRRDYPRGALFLQKDNR